MTNRRSEFLPLDVMSSDGEYFSSKLKLRFKTGSNVIDVFQSLPNGPVAVSTSSKEYCKNQGGSPDLVVKGGDS